MTQRAFTAAFLGVALLTGVGACGPGINATTPVEPKSECIDLTGAYRANFTTSCGQSATTLPVSVSQAACTITTTIPGLGGLSGKIVKDQAAVTLDFASPCSGQATGTATIATGRIDAAFAGTQSGTGACCSVVSGTVSVFK